MPLDEKKQRNITKRKKLLVLCPNPVGYAPGQRLKYEQYFNCFRENGYDVTVSPFISEKFQAIVYKKGHFFKKAFWTLAGYGRRVADLFRVARYDVVYVFLWVTPFGPPLFERLVRLFSRRIIYDIDDMIYLPDYKSKANPIISKLKGNNKPVYLFKAADCVVTSTEAIETFAGKLNSRVVNIPISVNTGIYRPRNTYELSSDKIILGWSGSYSTSPYLHLLDDVLLELNKEHPFKLLVMGDENFSIPGIDIQAIPWKEEYETETISTFDIGLYPLPVNEWVLGKGGGKALQYMALGVPTVATDVGINYKIINSGENGFLVKSREDWLISLKTLINNKELREKMGRNGVQTVEERYSVNANKNLYLSILNQTAAS